MNVKRWTHLVFGLLVITLMLVPSVKFTSAQEPKVLRTAVLPGDFYIDPSLGTWQSEILIINELFTGLTVNNVDTVVPEPGLATEWTTSPGCAMTRQREKLSRLLMTPATCAM
jgi:ABC-type oligopeptide transport system substrate-binding subunit